MRSLSIFTPKVFLLSAILAAPGVACAIPSEAKPAIIVNTAAEPVAPGKFQPTWDSLKQYQEAPAWFHNAKFGIWAHWGPQCQPEDGDWYARGMYDEGTDQNKFHNAHYGPPSKFGFKDVIHEWKAENWDPEKLMALYKRAGAQYFFALANHHDNFDNWDSKYQTWNSVAVGPKKDLIGGWEKAARKNGLRFGVSVHASHAWTWYELSQGADKNGPLAGVPYDGNLTKADGKGLWWDGLDPQDLYAQNHPRSRNNFHMWDVIPLWDWDNGATLPDQAYCDKFYNRTIDLINKYHPDLIYFDDTALPLWPASDAGLKIAAHYYNSSMQWHSGRNEAVIFGKILTPDQRECVVWDCERGVSNQIEPQPWQTDTCLGDWHYKLSIFENHQYKSTKTVIQMLADVVSKNGNLLLNVPLRGDGTPDSDEIAVVEGIAAWMKVNRACIFDTRPWKKCGEGPALAAAAPIKAQGFNEGKGKPFTPEDIRFTTKDDTLYAITLGVPTGEVRIKSLGKNAGLAEKSVAAVKLLGSRKKLKWKQEDDALVIQAPATWPCENAVVFAINFAR